MDNIVKEYMTKTKIVKAIKITRTNYEEALVLFNGAHNDCDNHSVKLWMAGDELYEIEFNIYGEITYIREGDYLVFERNNKWMPHNREDFNSIYQEIINDMQLFDYKKEFKKDGQ